jgi:Protein of unknown function (DUF1203)
MHFQIHALSSEPFAPLFAMSDASLAERQTRRVVADRGAPCRVSLRDAEPGETLLLTHFEHQSANTPFRASHAIYVRERAVQAYPEIGEVPDQLRGRIMSLRGFDAAGMMLVADLADGVALEEGIAAIFADPSVDYVHLHFAKQGCYAARVMRA